jgi:uncharacterized protein (DUF2062 family)
VRELLVRAKARFVEVVGLHDRPEHLAAAWALGIAIGLSPLMGRHTVLALVLAIILRLNKIDVILGTLIINPWTIAFYFPAAVFVGRRVTGVHVPHFVRFHPEAVLHAAVWRENAPWLRSILLAWGVGAAIFSLLLGSLTYLLLRRIIRVHREHHRRRHASACGFGPSVVPPSSDGDRDSSDNR